MSFRGCIVRSDPRQEEIGRVLKSVALNSVRKVLPDRAVDTACQAADYEYRQRLLVPVVVVLHMVMAALSPEGSFAASWSSLWCRLVGALPGAAGRSPDSGALSKARRRLPLKVFERVFEWLSKQFQAQAGVTDMWRGLRQVLVDGTHVSMPATPELFAAFDRGHGKHGSFRYPIARVVTLALAESMGVVAYKMGGYLTSEKSLLRDILGRLSPGDLLIGDRGFAGAKLYVEYLRAGLQFVTRAHQCLKLGRLPRMKSFSEGDFVTELKVNPAYIRQDPSLPKKLPVRVIKVEARVRGIHEVIWLVTSLLDAAAYPAAEIAELYLRRWRIEGSIRELKVGMGADVLRSKSPDGVRKELAARMIALNVVHSIVLEAAGKHGLQPVRISFVNATRAVVNFAAAMASAPVRTLPTLYDAMLTEVASNTVPHRPDRIEPRALRREKNNYPALRSTRADWRAAQLRA